MDFHTDNGQSSRYEGYFPNSLRLISYLGFIWDSYVLGLKTKVFVEKTPDTNQFVANKCLNCQPLTHRSRQAPTFSTKVGFIYTFWYSLSSTSSILEQRFQSVVHLQITSSEGFHHHFKICLLWFLHKKECSFYTHLFCCTEMR